MFNPTRAREEREEEEARVLAAQWGSTPERAKEIVKRTKEEKDLDFQVQEQVVGDARGARGEGMIVSRISV